MADVTELDRAHGAIMGSIVETGRAPHFTELAAELDVPVAAARDLQSEVTQTIPGWLHPGTDYIASFPPFNLQPTQYRISVNERDGWYAQCGFEAMAVRWLFPGSTVRIDAPCLDCGEPMVGRDARCRDPARRAGDDGRLLARRSRRRRRDATVPLSGDEPLPVGRTRPQLERIRDRLRLHAPAGARWAEIFSGPFFVERGREDYISWLGSEAGRAAFDQLRSELPSPTG